MKPKLKKWRIKTPNKHKSFAIKRNREERNIWKENQKQLQELS